MPRGDESWLLDAAREEEDCQLVICSGGSNKSNKKHLSEAVAAGGGRRWCGRSNFDSLPGQSKCRTFQLSNKLDDPLCAFAEMNNHTRRVCWWYRIMKSGGARLTRKGGTCPEDREKNASRNDLSD